MRELLRRLVWLLVAVELLWLVGANGVLNSGWGRSLAPAGETHVSWSAGFTPVPGALLMWGFQVESPAVVLEVDEVFAAWWAPAVRNREVLLLGARVRGVDITVHPDPPLAAQVAGGGWRVLVPGARVTQVRSVAVDGVALAGGAARVRGDVDIALGGDTRVDGLVARWSDGQILHDGQLVVEQVEAQASGTVLAHPTRRPTVNGTLSLAGRAATLEPLGDALLAEWVEGLRGSGELQADLTVGPEGLAPGSTLRVDADTLHLATLGYDAVGSGTVLARADDGLHTEVRFGPFEVHRENDGPLQVRGEGLVLSARTEDVDPFDGVTGLTVTLELPEVEMPDVAALQVYLPADVVEFRGGSATVSALLSGAQDGDGVRGKVRLRGEALDGRYAHLGMATDLAVDLDITGGDLSERQLRVGRSTLVLSQTRLTEGARSWDWGASVTVLGGVVTLSSPLALESTVEVALPDASGVLAMVGRVDSWLGHFEALFDVRDITLEARLGLSQRRLHVRHLELEAEGLRGAAELDLGPEPQALAWMRLGALGVGVLRTDALRHWQLIGARHWYQQQVGAFWRR